MTPVPGQSTERWTLHGSGHPFVGLKVDGPYIKNGESVEVVRAGRLVEAERRAERLEGLVASAARMIGGGDFRGADGWLIEADAALAGSSAPEPIRCGVDCGCTPGDCAADDARAGSSAPAGEPREGVWCREVGPGIHPRYCALTRGHEGGCRFHGPPVEFGGVPAGDEQPALERVATAIARTRRARVAAGLSRECAEADDAYARAVVLALSGAGDEQEADRG